MNDRLQKQLDEGSMEYDDWCERFKPVPNPYEPNSGYDGCLFDPAEAAVYKAFNKTKGKMWTLIEEDGEAFIVSGFRFVNRLGYFFTEKSFNPSDSLTVFFYNQEDEVL